MSGITKVVIGLGTLLASAYLIQPYRPVIVRGRSMLPTFDSGQVVFAVPLSRVPRDGDIVLVEKDGMLLIKRVALAPGEKYLEAYVPLAHRWDHMTNAPAIRRMVRAGRIPCRMSTIPRGQMYILGDNPDVSLDSRNFGLVPIASIRGLVVPIG